MVRKKILEVIYYVYWKKFDFPSIMMPSYFALETDIIGMSIKINEEEGSHIQLVKLIDKNKIC